MMIVGFVIEMSVKKTKYEIENQRHEETSE